VEEPLSRGGRSRGGKAPTITIPLQANLDKKKKKAPRQGESEALGKGGSRGKPWNRGGGHAGVYTTISWGEDSESRMRRRGKGDRKEKKGGRPPGEERLDLGSTRLTGGNLQPERRRTPIKCLPQKKEESSGVQSTRKWARKPGGGR